MDLRAWVDHRARMNVRTRQGRMHFAPELGQASKVEVGLVDDDASDMFLRLFSHRWRNNDAGGRCRGKLVLKFRIAEKAQLLGLGRLQGSQAFNIEVGVAMQLTPQVLNDGS